MFCFLPTFSILLYFFFFFDKITWKSPTHCLRVLFMITISKMLFCAIKNWTFSTMTNCWFLFELLAALQGCRCLSVVWYSIEQIHVPICEWISGLDNVDQNYSQNYPPKNRTSNQTEMRYGNTKWHWANRPLRFEGIYKTWFLFLFSSFRFYILFSLMLCLPLDSTSCCHFGIYYLYSFC